MRLFRFIVLAMICSLFTGFGNPWGLDGKLGRPDRSSWGNNTPFSRFNPLDLDWKFWLDAAEGARDTSGNPCTDGINCKDWLDKTGNNNDYTQTTISNQLIYRVSVAALGGKPGLEAGGDDFMTATVNHGIGTGDYTFYCRFTSTTGNTYSLLMRNNTGFYPAYVAQRDCYTRPSCSFIDILWTLNTTVDVIFERISGINRCWINGVLSSNTYNNSWDFQNGVLQIGKDAGSNYFIGHIRYLALMNGSLTDAKRSKFHKWMGR